MTNAIGEDRSSYQTVGPWNNDAFGFAKATEGTGWRDPTFFSNWLNLASEGKVRGAYHFFHPAEDAVAQAQFFVDTVKASGGFKAGDIFIADVEIVVGADGAERFSTARAADRAHTELLTSLKPLLTSPASTVAVGEGALAFLDEVSRLAGPHCPVLIYTDLFMAQNLLGLCSGYPLFLAYYNASLPSSVAPWKTWTFWQTGATGSGGGDFDYFNGNAGALLQWQASYAGTNWTETLVNNLPTLQEGARDQAGQTWFVHRLQNEVAGYGRWNTLGAVTAIKDDGAFGPATKAAVEAVQRHAGLQVDGVAGPKTWTLLIG